MSASTEVVHAPRLHRQHRTLADDVLAGLSRYPKSLSSVWFYDDRGSRWFEQITELEDYYLTRCERDILESHAADIAEVLGPEPFRVIEIGAGDGQKTQILLRRFLDQGLDFEYLPIDICRRSIVDLVTKLRLTLGTDVLRVRGIVGEYHDGLSLLQDHEPRRNLVLFLGSSIGNFDHVRAQKFLKGLRRSLQRGDAALIGFDLKKEPGLLLRAYDDSAGVTREFNLNLLDRINRELGGEFDRRTFLHHAAYNVPQGCMESYLISRVAQDVPVRRLGRSFHFDAWEGIQVEYSYKYDVPLIEQLAAAGGFQVVRHMFDERRWFADSLWVAD